MNKYIFKIAISLVFLFLLDRGIGACLKYIYFKPKNGKYHDLTYALDSTRADVIIIGSSRAAHSYVARQIEDSLHVSCYNAGVWGSHFLQQYAILKSICQRYHPKIILWDYWEGLKKDDIDYLELTGLLPYYDTHPDIKETVDFGKPYERYKMLSKIYPYNSTPFYNLNQLASVYKSADKAQTDKGFLPLKRISQEALQQSPFSGAVMGVDTNCINRYRAALAYCMENNIKLFMVMSPYFGIYKNPANYDLLAEETAKKEGVPFLDFLNDSTLLSSPRYFSEPKHLNEEGAHLFTGKIIKAIQKTAASQK